MKCIIYARTATEKQAKEVNSLETQEKALKECAKRNNLEVAKVITEVASGNDNNRKGLKTLINLISSGEYKTILCSSIDRLSRNFLTFLDFYKLAIDKKLEIITLNGTYRPDLEKGLPNIISFGFAQTEKYMMSEKIKRGIRQAKLRKK